MIKACLQDLQLAVSLETLEVHFHSKVLHAKQWLGPYIPRRSFTTVLQCLQPRKPGYVATLAIPKTLMPGGRA